MAKGLPEDCTVLNIGFLNDRCVCQGPAARALPSLGIPPGLCHTSSAICFSPQRAASFRRSIEERRAEYASTYDIVIEGDPSMDFVNQLFNAIASGEAGEAGH